MKVWYTSDLHFRHKKVSELRGFESVEDHDQAITDNWNSVVGKNDIVWVLGDAVIGSGGLDSVALLNGRKHLITGNHDAPFPGHRDSHKAQAKWFLYFESIQAFARRKVRDIEFMMSHFPYPGPASDHTETERYPGYRLRDTGMLLVHGHTHEGIRVHPQRPRQLHVGLDAWDLRPVPEDTVVEMLRLMTGTRPEPPRDCIAFCDEDCMHGPVHCADIHQPDHRQHHRGQPCPGIHVCGLGPPEFSCCHPDGGNRIVNVEKGHR
jgi:calcineurin-like phosphoesterase family protein